MSDIVKYSFTNDLVFKASLERCPKSAIALIKEFIPDLKNMDINQEVTFLNKENIDGVDISTTIFDVNIRIENKIVELEMQNKKPDYEIRSRMLRYYIDLFKNSFEKGSYNYKPSYCLWFIGFKMFDDDIMIREFKLSDIKHDMTLIDDSGIIIVEFAKFKKSGYNNNRWYNLFLTNDLSKLRGEPLMNELVDSIKELNNDDDFVFRIDERERAEREYNARMQASQEKIQKAKEELQKTKDEIQKTKNEIQKMKDEIQKTKEEIQGLQQGEKKKAFEIAKKLKSMGLVVEQIIEATGLSKEEIETL